MPSLKVLKTRIASVKSTQQITRAMKLVAAAKMKRAIDAALASRPYSDEVTAVLQSLMARIDQVDNPLLQAHEEVKNVAVITAKNAEISNLAGLEHCRSLALLDLEGNQISDLFASHPLESELKTCRLARQLRLLGRHLRGESLLRRDELALQPGSPRVCPLIQRLPESALFSTDRSSSILQL